MRFAQNIDPTLNVAVAAQRIQEILDESIRRTDIINKLITWGDQSAREDNLAGAIDQYRYVLEIQPDYDLNPEVRAAALSQLQKALALVETGQVSAALQIFEQVLQQIKQNYPTFTIAPNFWNGLCWHGSLNNQAAQVLFACEQAVTLSNGDAGIRDSRGLARALNGDTAGAIQDFQAVVDSPKYYGDKAQTRQWIADLQAGKNPFTPEVLESFK